MNENPIGFIDSGIGGLSVWNSVVKLLPNESTIYVGDHAFMPYGDRTGNTVRNRISKIIKWLILRKCKAIVIACNTATVAGIDIYRNHFPELPIIGVVPVIKTATEATKTSHIAVLATPSTIKSRYQQNLIKKFADGIRVTSFSCRDLVTRIENGNVRENSIRQELSMLITGLTGSDIDVIALGCTHYPLIRPEIRKIVGKSIKLLDSGDAVARQTKRIMEHNCILSNGNHVRYDFYTTGDAVKVSRTAGKITQKKYDFRSININ